jgi:hypothetical protein
MLPQISSHGSLKYPPGVSSIAGVEMPQASEVSVKTKCILRREYFADTQIVGQSFCAVV